ncbi:hypothetical protein [Neobacillus sp. DY30]|uniref:hypothetical protein n=1 Tax=Neobacillus sp. DY30 TaxID=3047871 RepID=UPI0024C06EAB|nr:hypothetical protein [Neobacillus sp. DY30]WHY00356.1 hypothetical protein QNH29_28185 [Neobacillus sp. DY30]
MEINRNMTKLRIMWHSARINYLKQLLDSCLDTIIQTKLRRKITYHYNRLIDLN